jgi:hypothetical protein
VLLQLQLQFRFQFDFAAIARLQVFMPDWDLYPRIMGIFEQKRWHY